MRLAGWEKAGADGLIDWDITRLTIITAKGIACEACEELEGVEFSYKEVCRQMPLPVPECTNESVRPRQRGWCRCTYGLVFHR